MTLPGQISSDYLKFANVEESVKDNFINYSDTDFYGYKRSLINYIKAVYPLDYNNFIESDLGVMLIELVAYIGATTSLKADLLANENFIRTARNRNNIKNLLELIGIRMKGPISAVANAQITFNQSPFINLTDRIEITAANRVIQISSPEDGGQLNFTLYKIENGVLSSENPDSSIILYAEEADNYDGTPESATVFTNLVLIEGAFVRQTGQFNNSRGIKTIQLDKSPVIEGSVNLYIEGSTNTSGTYERLDNIFFASGSSHKAFQIVSDDDFRVNITLGDGINSISPAAGDFYYVTYRVGGGSRGNISNEVINANLTFTNIDSAEDSATAIIENISNAYGGSDAETVEHAKRFAPLFFRSQDRLVTLRDYKAFINTFISSFGTVGKGTAATRKAYSSANIIDLFILEKASDLQLKKASPNFKKELLDSVETKKMLTDHVVVVDGLIRTLDLILTAKIDRSLKNTEEIIKLKIRNAVLNYFNVDNTDFNKPFIISDFLRRIYEIQEVRAITLNNIDQDIYVDFNEILQLNNITINIELI